VFTKKRVELISLDMPKDVLLEENKEQISDEHKIFNLLRQLTIAVQKKTVEVGEGL
jgi:hypothetical protein